MGSAFVSVADDASTIYWNPAGIVNILKPEVQSYYAPWLVETQYYYNTAIVPMGTYGSLGISFTAITMDEMLVRTVQDPEPNKYGQKFNAGNIALGVAYAKKLTDRFSFGFQTKFIQELLDNKLLTIRAAENVIRILPPLNVKKSEINLALKIIKKVCKNYKL